MGHDCKIKGVFGSSSSFHLLSKETHCGLGGSHLKETQQRPAKIRK